MVLKIKCVFCFVVLLIILGGGSCNTDEVLPEYEKKLVVDGWIENGNLPKVLLTFTSPYFSEIDSFSIREYLASRAKVTVFSPTSSEILVFKPSNIYFPPNVYQGLLLTGYVNQKYKVEVILDGDTAWAETTIPEPPVLDSAWFEPNSPGDTLGIIHVIINDNPDEENFYRIFTYTEGLDKRYRPVLVPNYSDEQFNGESFQIPVYQGNETNIDPDDQIFFNLNYSTMLKVCSMDKKAYEYWTSFQREYINFQNPLAGGGKSLKSNINGGIGIWCGYGVTKYHLLPVKKE